MDSKIRKTMLCVILAVAMVFGTTLSISAQENPVTTGVATTEPAYTVVADPQGVGTELLVNGNVAIENFSDAACGWKDLGWAGFDQNRLKITYGWEVNTALDGMTIGFAQDIAVEANTDYTFRFTVMEWNVSGKADNDLTVGILDTTKEGIVYKEGTTQTVHVGHGITKDVTMTINTGDAQNIRLAVTTDYQSPNAASAFGGYFINNLSLKAVSAEKLTNADLQITDFAAAGCGWTDLGWGGFDGNRLKLTWAWFADANINGNLVAVGQEIAVEKNTYYCLQFNAMQYNVSGRDNHDLIVGFADPNATGSDPYLEGQKAVVSGVGEEKTYYVAFWSGDHDKVVLRFETTYEAPVNDCTFGGFFISNTSLREIVLPEEEPPVEEPDEPSKTGDGMLALPVALLVVSGAAAALMVHGKKRRGA